MRFLRVTISTYLKWLGKRETIAAVLHTTDVRDLRRDHSSQHAVTATWQISFEQIGKSIPEASDLLALMCIFNKQGIPRNLPQRNMSQLQFEDAVAQWVNFSLIKRGNKSFEMHRLL